MKKTIIIIAVILIVLVGGYFVLQRSYRTPTLISMPIPTTAKATTLVPEQATAPASAVKEFIVLGTEFSFSPSLIRVKGGDRIKITFKNNGRVPHNLVIESLGVGTKKIEEDETETIEFTAPASGIYPIFCSIPGHRASGMEGNLIVE